LLTASCSSGTLDRNLEARVSRMENKLDRLISALRAAQALPPPEPDPKLTYAVPIAASDPVEGAADAKITLVEAFEFACPYCWRAQPTLEALKQKYGKDLRVVHKYILIHGMPAVPAGLGACAAALQGKYAEMNHGLWSKLFDEQGQIQQDQLTPDSITAVARDLGLDMTSFEREFQGETCVSWIQDSGPAMAKLGTRATPSFYINGRHIGGAQPLAAFDAVIQEEMARADKAIAAGTKAADYYRVAVVEKGLKEVSDEFSEAAGR
jgi:protein-disulfide isomerase